MWLYLKSNSLYAVCFDSLFDGFDAAYIPDAQEWKT